MLNCMISITWQFQSEVTERAPTVTHLMRWTDLVVPPPPQLLRDRQTFTCTQPAEACPWHRSWRFTHLMDHLYRRFACNALKRTAMYVGLPVNIWESRRIEGLCGGGDVRTAMFLSPRPNDNLEWNWSFFWWKKNEIQVDQRFSIAGKYNFELDELDA